MKKIKKYFLPLVILFGLFLRLLFLNQHAFWFDEAFSYFIAKQDIPNLFLATLADNNPPFYYVILHEWMKLFGNGITSLRILSCIIGGSTIILFYFFVKKLFNTKTAQWSTVIFALSPAMIYFSTETRMYSLFILLSLVTTFTWILILKKPLLSFIILFVCSFSLSLYTHYYSFLLFFPYLIMVSISQTKSKLKLFILLLIPGLLTLPWIKEYFLYSHPSVYAQPSIIALPSSIASFILGGTGVVTLKTFFSQKILFEIKLLFVITLLFSIFLAIKGFLFAKNAKAGKYIIILTSIPLILLTFVNLFKPVFSVRSVIFLAPFFYILIGIGITSLKQKHQLFIGGSIIFCFLFILYLFYSQPIFSGPPIKKALQNIDKQKIIFHASVLTYYPIQYYLKETSKNVLITSNPLSPQTIATIGGKKQPLTTKLESLTLVYIANGADQKEMKLLFKNLNDYYIEKKRINEAEISIYYFEKKK